MATSQEQRDFIAATKPDLEPMEYFAEAVKHQEPAVEQDNPKTEAQEATAEKVELLKEDPNATRHDTVSAEAANHFNDRAHGVEDDTEQKQDAKQEAKEAGQEEGKNEPDQDRETSKDKPEPVLKPESERGKGLSFEDWAAEAFDKIPDTSQDQQRGQERDAGMGMG